jgi:hypothetical protein
LQFAGYSTRRKNCVLMQKFAWTGSAIGIKARMMEPDSDLQTSASDFTDLIAWR